MKRERSIFQVYSTAALIGTDSSNFRLAFRNMCYIIFFLFSTATSYMPNMQKQMEAEELKTCAIVRKSQNQEEDEVYDL